MTPPCASVVIVSRHRPAQLALCLRALERQSHPGFEVILVADPSAVGLRPDLPLKRVAFVRANISAARNLGVAQAAAPVVAFIDDDAVPEPGWLARLSAPFADPQVLAATGYTRGPGGQRWQARAQRVGPDGMARDVDLPGDAPQLLAPDSGGAVSTLGTNCAFRRDALRGLGGFDEDFSYFLDESDLNLRMARRWPEMRTAVVPRAQVIHGIAPGTGRDAVAVRDLRIVGRSAALFWRKHRPQVDPAPAFIALQRARLIRSMLAGAIDPFAVSPIMRSLTDGLRDGEEAPLSASPNSETSHDSPQFQRFPACCSGARVISGWIWQADRLRKRAAALAGDGQAATLLLLSPTGLPHRTGFHPGGWWEQRGGLWGRSAARRRLGGAARAAWETEHILTQRAPE